MNDNALAVKRRLLIAGAVGVLVLLAVGIGVLGTWYCDTTNVPAGANAIPNSIAKAATPWGPSLWAPFLTPTMMA